MLGKVAGYGKKIKLVITGLASICEVMHSESGRHSDYTFFLTWNNTLSIELGFGRRFSIATQQRVTPLQRQREPGQHDSAERTLEADYTFFLYGTIR